MTFEFNKKNVGELSEFQFFRTPVTALDLLSLDDFEPKNFLEPCAGDGAICDYLKSLGKKTYYYELYEPFHSTLDKKGYQKVGSNFFCNDNFAFDTTIMNPPFAKKAWVPFIKRAIQVTKGPVYVLLGCSSEAQIRKESGLEADMISEHLKHKFSDGLKIHNIGCAWFVIDGTAEGREDGIPTIPLPMIPKPKHRPCPEVVMKTVDYQVRNPETNRMIQVDGRVYKGLVKAGYCHLNGQLVKI